MRLDLSSARIALERRMPFILPRPRYTCAIYRIVGNDLPPRHKPGQAFENTRFIVDNEPRADGFHRTWILNHIIDPDEARRLDEFLASRGEERIVIPFDRDAYMRYARAPEGRSRNGRILRAIGLNAARNRALAEGRRRALWTIPLDGSCCFDQAGYRALVGCLGASGQAGSFFLIPMYRVRDNAEFASFDPSGREVHEYQIAFGRAYGRVFDARVAYGEEDKIELLRRMGLRLKLTEYAQIVVGSDERKCGYVIRLSSGVAEAEGEISKRVALREESLDRLLRRIGG